MEDPSDSQYGENNYLVSHNNNPVIKLIQSCRYQSEHIDYVVTVNLGNKMELSFGKEYEQFREEVRAFISKHHHKAPRETGRPSKKAKDWQKRLIEQGYAARTIPKKFGGYGGSPNIIESRIIAEEFARARISPGLTGQGVSMLIPTLLEMGSEKQKQEFIKPTLTGDIVWCQGYSEPEAGSDLASLRTQAVLDNNEWVINGQKIWTSSAHIADWMFCLVRTELDMPKHKGISFLLVKMDTPGIEVRPLVDMTGKANFNETFFTDVRIPANQIVGKRGEGWLVANSILGHERDSLGDPNVTLTRLHALIDLMKNETVDGKPIIDLPIYQDRLIQIQGRVMAMRYNDMRILSAKINGKKDAGLARLIVKLQGTELRHDLEGLAIDVMGELGIGYGKENDYLREKGNWQAQYMFYLGLIIGGGTSQIQKNIIAERGLGLPKEPRATAIPPQN